MKYLPWRRVFEEVISAKALHSTLVFKGMVMGYIPGNGAKCWPSDRNVGRQIINSIAGTTLCRTDGSMTQPHEAEL